MDLPVAAPVGRPFPDLCDHGIEVGARLMRRMRQMVEIRGSRQPADLQQVVERCPCPASSRTTALRSRFVTSAPAGPAFFQVRDLRLQVGDLLGQLLLPRGFRPWLGFRAFGPALGLRPQRLRATGTVFAAPTLQRGDARYPVPGHDLGHAQAVLDVVPRRRDLRLPAITPVAGGSHDRLPAVGSVQHDPFFRSLHGHRKPTGEGAFAHAGLNEPQRLAPEPVVIVLPPILTHTKEPHLQSSNPNFFSPIIGVRFNPTCGSLGIRASFSWSPTPDL